MIYFNASGVGHRIPGGVNPLQASMHLLRSAVPVASCVVISDERW